MNQSSRQPRRASQSLRRSRAAGLGRPAGLLLMALAVATMCVGLGCGDRAPTCYPAEYRSCQCGDVLGYQRCEGADYGSCDCSGAVPGLGGGVPTGGGAPTGGAGGAGGTGGASLLPYLAACDDNAQCETGLCYPFNAKGPHCTKPCVDNRDCPAPSPGCNNMGVCKVP